MKPRPFDYVRPDTVEEAVAILAEHGDDARILAGGHPTWPASPSANWTTI
jgi:CO/xanthine dehydrogenase FAD-binding subunit